MTTQVQLDQYFTPTWAAERIVRRYFPDLNSGDVVAEPSCGDGRFLMAIPREVDAFGVEIDPVYAAEAAKNSGRHVICGDFNIVNLPKRPTVVIGNPPFQANIIDGFIERCYQELDYGGRVGFLMPVYMFQTASRVMGYQRRWSISQEMMPRNLFERLTCPLMFAKFIKDRQTVVSGLFLYAETDAIASLKEDVRRLILGNNSTANCWRDAIELALVALGGRATLSQLYSAIENNRPTNNPWWREKIRQVAGMHFNRVAVGEYALESKAA